MLEKMRNDGGNNTDEWVNVMVVFVGCLPYILLAIAAASRLDIVMPAAVNATNGVLRSQIIVFIIATLAIWIVVHITIQVRATQFGVPARVAARPAPGPVYRQALRPPASFPPCLNLLLAVCQPHPYVPAGLSPLARCYGPPATLPPLPRVPCHTPNSHIPTLPPLPLPAPRSAPTSRSWPTTSPTASTATR